MSASDVSPFHLRFARFTQLSDTCRRPFLVCGSCVCLCLVVLFSCFPAVLLQVAEKFNKFLHLYSSR